MYKRKIKKNKLYVPVWAVSIMLVAGMMTGCSTTEPDSSETQTENILPSKEPADKKIPDEELTDNSSVEMLSYHNPSFELEYPDTWEIKEESGEDGNTVRFYDEKGEAVFWFEQGEAWRVDLNTTKENYKEILTESWQEVEIEELSEVKVDGYDARKLIFTCTVNGEKRTITKYICVVGYAFFELNFMDSADATHVDSIAAVLESIVFTNTGN